LASGAACAAGVAGVLASGAAAACVAAGFSVPVARSSAGWAARLFVDERSERGGVVDFEGIGLAILVVRIGWAGGPAGHQMC
jgi:cell division protein FtsX